MPERVTYCDDSMLAYRSARRIFQPGERLVFDEGYRLAHLPLVNPGHPAVIPEIEGRDYRYGTYEKSRYALVMPLSDDVLRRSEPFQALDRAIRSTNFAPKIAWDLGESRRSKLHATLISGIEVADLDRCAASVQNTLDSVGPVSVCLKGPFAGTRNTGRIYFPVHPQNVGGEDPFARLQACIGAVVTRLYLVGYYHMREELDESETKSLAGLLDQWRDQVLVTTTIPFLELHATNDDLALSARCHSRISARTP